GLASMPPEATSPAPTASPHQLSPSVPEAAPSLLNSDAATAPAPSPQYVVAAPEGDGATVALLDWRASWIAASAMTPCGSCTGRACTMCSIRTGGPAAGNDQPTGYSQRVLEFYQPVDAPADAGGVTLARGATTDALVNLTGTPNAIVLEN